jgi:hypothetical protein
LGRYEVVFIHDEVAVAVSGQTGPDLAEGVAPHGVIRGVDIAVVVVVGIDRSLQPHVVEFSGVDDAAPSMWRRTIKL